MAAALDALRADPRVAAAERYVREEDERTLATQIELSEIPAPPFQEEARGRRAAALFDEAGLLDVRTDPAGNVTGRAGPRGGAPLVVSAHLDTVFPEGTDVRVTREGDVLRGPGISDDARGLAALLAVARALGAAGLRTGVPILFAATVGEEGVGDLRGVKELFADGGAAAGAAGFVSLDGAGLDRIVVRGLGSRRFRVSALGPGGHSWVDWGTPNPIHALGALVGRLVALELPHAPTATLTVARWGGGKSINAIPQEAWIELDTRCEEDARLEALEREIRRLVADGAEGAGSGVDLRLRVIGRRPGGATDPEARLVRAAVAATRAAGAEPEMALSSTDANIPMALGVPAITIGCGGEAGKAHTTDEWYRNVRGPQGIVRALRTVLLVSGIEAGGPEVA